MDVWEIPADFDWDKEPPFGTMPLPLRHYYYDSSSPSMDHQNRNEQLEQRRKRAIIIGWLTESSY